ncbi:hypothetical protein AcW1_007703 [Taiwanofungus camphoratus]|nr:hypothetical protein AcW1_007703 [Antrodia cinnamomea]
MSCNTGALGIQIQDNRKVHIHGQNPVVKRKILSMAIICMNRSMEVTASVPVIAGAYAEACVVLMAPECEVRS